MAGTLLFLTLNCKPETASLEKHGVLYIENATRFLNGTMGSSGLILNRRRSFAAPSLLSLCRRGRKRPRLSENQARVGEDKLK